MLQKISGILLLLFLIFAVWAEQSRSFYCISEGKCVTVWKRSGNKCYIVLNKYYGIFKPSQNYIKTKNTDLVYVIWTYDNRLLIDAEDDAQIIQPTSDKALRIENYNSDKIINDSLYTYFDGKYNKYIKNVDYISLQIKESYATDRTGKKLK